MRFYPKEFGLNLRNMTDEKKKKKCKHRLERLVIKFRECFPASVKCYSPRSDVAARPVTSLVIDHGTYITEIVE